MTATTDILERVPPRDLTVAVCHQLIHVQTHAELRQTHASRDAPEAHHQLRMHMYYRTMLCALLGIAPRSVAIVVQYDRETSWEDPATGLIEFLTPLHRHAVFRQLWRAMTQAHVCLGICTLFVVDVRDTLRRYLCNDTAQLVMQWVPCDTPRSLCQQIESLECETDARLQRFVSFRDYQ